MTAKTTAPAPAFAPLLPFQVKPRLSGSRTATVHVQTMYIDVPHGLLKYRDQFKVVGRNLFVKVPKPEATVSTKKVITVDVSACASRGAALSALHREFEKVTGWSRSAPGVVPQAPSTWVRASEKQLSEFNAARKALNDRIIFEMEKRLLRRLSDTNRMRQVYKKRLDQLDASDQRNAQRLNSLKDLPGFDAEAHFKLGEPAKSKKATPKSLTKPNGANPVKAAEKSSAAPKTKKAKSRK